MTNGQAQEQNTERRDARDFRTEGDRFEAEVSASKETPDVRENQEGGYGWGV